MGAEYELVGESPRRTKIPRPVMITIIVVACAIAIGTIVAVIVVALSHGSDDDEPKFDFGIIIDAGSSGSRIYVYDWPHRADNSTIPVVAPVKPPEIRVRQVGQQTFVPAYSSFFFFFFLFFQQYHR